MIKIKKLNNRGMPNSFGLRLAKLGEVITLKNGDIVGVAPHIDACSKNCYFADNNGVMGFCKGAYIVKREVPNFECYVKTTKFKNCFLRTGWHFVKMGSKKEGI